MLLVERSLLLEAYRENPGEFVKLYDHSTLEKSDVEYTVSTLRDTREHKRA
jgi:hypothetical protein